MHSGNGSRHVPGTRSESPPLSGRTTRTPADRSAGPPRRSGLAAPAWRLTGLNAFVNMSKMEWEIHYFREDVQDVIMAFPAGIQARYIHLTERMVHFGPDLGMPHTRALGKGLFELRLKAKEGIGR